MTKNYIFGSGIYGFFLTLFAFLGLLAGEALFLTYGILALIPVWPFEDQNLKLGVPLIILAGVGIAGLTGMIAAGCIVHIVYNVCIGCIGCIRCIRCYEESV